MKYTLKCGKFEYKVVEFSAECDALEALIYWSFNREHARQKIEAYTAAKKPEEVREWGFTEAECDTAIHDLFKRFDALNVPNWVVNGALFWGENKDIRAEGISAFFYKSEYSATPLEAIR